MDLEGAVLMVSEILGLCEVSRIDRAVLFGHLVQQPRKQQSSCGIMTRFLPGCVSPLIPLHTHTLQLSLSLEDSLGLFSPGW